jgi:hypothetical protein
MVDEVYHMSVWIRLVCVILIFAHQWVTYSEVSKLKSQIIQAQLQKTRTLMCSDEN